MENSFILWTKHIFIRNVIASSNTRILEKCTSLICWSFEGGGLEFRLLISTKSMAVVMLNVLVVIVAKKFHFPL